MAIADLQHMLHKIDAILHRSDFRAIRLDHLHVFARVLAHFKKRLQQKPMTLESKPAPGKPTPRIEAIDLARGIALLAMAIYHFTWDLEFFGYAEPGLTAHGDWKLFARLIASSFLLLVGVGLILAHDRGVRWHGFLRRLAMLVAAAAAITAVTYFVAPGDLIFFGILHQIALASLLGLAFLRLPGGLTLLAATAFVTAPHYLRAPAFDHPALWWVGLSTAVPRSNDYVPLFPWFGAVLAGIGSAKLAQSAGIIAWLATFKSGSWSKPLRFAGRHSLAVYLIHQPLLIACVWALSRIAPPPLTETQGASVIQSCEQQCVETRDAAFCRRYCGCVLDRIEQEGLADELFGGAGDNGLQTRLEGLAMSCAADSDRAQDEEHRQ